MIIKKDRAERNSQGQSFSNIIRFNAFEYKCECGNNISSLKIDLFKLITSLIKLLYIIRTIKSKSIQAFFIFFQDKKNKKFKKKK